MSSFKRALTRAQVIAIAIVVALVATGVAYYTAFLAPQPQQRPPPGAKPIVFVHGGAGSAQQFESQAMRFTSNGYPPSYIWVFEYDSSHAIETLDKVLSRLDAFVEEVLNSTRADKVDLVGHSYGGLIVLMYLQRPEAREKVARCVVIDSLSALMRGYTKAPEGVKTLVIWGRARDPRYPQLIEGAVNVHFPEKNHVEVCTSAEAFVEMYKFFTGEKPATKDIVPEYEVWIAGRVVIFPINVFKEYPEGRPATLEIWEVDPATGRRVSDKPYATFEIRAPHGKWGPVKVRPGAYYEFCLVREGMRTHHFYREPFIRSNYWITLLTSLPGGIADLVERSDQHSALVIIRNKELEEEDVLKINGQNIITAKVFTKDKMVISVWLFDKNSDKANNITEPLHPFHGLTFQTALDFYIPAADPPDGTISIVLVPRQGGGRTQVLNVPNWASSKHAVTVQFNDYVQGA